MKLFLSSWLSNMKQSIILELGDLSWKKVAYITNAADEYIEKQWVDNLPWLQRDKDLLLELWCELIPVDLRKIQWTELHEVIDRCDGIFVGWGNSYYLRELMQTSWFDIYGREFLEKKDGFYLWSSAWSCVMGNYIKYLDEGEESYSFFDWLSYIPAIIFPHRWHERYLNRSLERFQRLFLEKKSIITLTDMQAIVGDEYGFRIVEEK